jgi:hypothetical protein
MDKTEKPVRRVGTERLASLARAGLQARRAQMATTVRTGSLVPPVPPGSPGYPELTVPRVSLDGTEK